MDVSSGSSVQQTPSNNGSFARPRFVLRPTQKFVIVAACVAAGLVLSVAAATQRLREDPNITSFGAWFWSPVETNAVSRLPAVGCTESSGYACQLNGIWASADGKEVWAVGNNGLVLHKADGKWQQAPFEVRDAIARVTEGKASAPPASGARLLAPASSPANGMSLTALLNALVPTAEAATPSQASSKPSSNPTTQSAQQSSPNKMGPSKPAPSQSSPPSFSPEQKAASPSTQPVQSQTSQQPLPNDPANAGPARGLEIDTGKGTQPASNAANPAANGVDLGAAQSKTGYVPPPSPRRSEPTKSSRGLPSKGGRPSSPSAQVHLPKPSGPPKFNGTSTDDLLAVYFTVDGQGWTLSRSGQVYHRGTGDTVWDMVSVATFTFADDAPSEVKPSITAAQIFMERDQRGATFGLQARWQGKVSKLTSSPDLVSFSGDLEKFQYHANAFEDYTDFEAASIPAALTPRGMTLHATYDAGGTRWGAGDHGLVVRSLDGGHNWLRETQGEAVAATADRRLPAPWYWCSMALLVGVCFVVMWAPEPVQIVQSVADWAVTDAPLKPGDLDALDFTPVALGLSRFIRNPKTQPPITLAIEGKWGEGKSSLMSLLCEDLRKSHLRPVWFNAWHHQSEEQLLGSLLENIRKQGLPPWWHFDNFIFRGRLLWLRFGRMWPLMTLLLLACVWTSAYEFAHHGHEHVPWTRSIANTVGTARGAWDNFWAKSDRAKDVEEGKTPPKDRPETDNKDAIAKGTAIDESGWAMLFSIVGFLGAISRKVKAFGVDSSKLATQVKEGVKVADLKPDPGIRRQFAREFGDVCRAWRWGSRRMIIFIDDLDRCRPDNVVTVLESVNFLTTAGDCFVVLGIAPETVTHCVGWSFKDIAESQAFCAGVANDEHAKAEARYKFGANYIKKLVNISVTLPKTTQEQRARVLQAKVERAAEEMQVANAPREHLWKRLAGTARVAWKLAPAIALVVLAIFSARMGYVAGNIAETTSTMPHASQTGSPAQPAPNSSDSAGKTPTATGVLEYTSPTGETAKLQHPTVRVGGAVLSFSAYVLLTALLISFAAYLLSERSNEDAQNSPQFELALSIWTGCIVTGCETPRELKRVINDLRYRAMTARDAGPTTTRGERVAKWLRRFVTGNGVQQRVVHGIDEAALVPQAVLAMFESVMTPGAIDRFRDHEDKGTATYNDLSLESHMMVAKKTHIDAFDAWPFAEGRAASVAAD